MKLRAKLSIVLEGKELDTVARLLMERSRNETRPLEDAENEAVDVYLEHCSRIDRIEKILEQH